MARLMIIQGHPDVAGGHLCHALAEAYAQAAREAGHDAATIEVAGLAFPRLQAKEEFENGPLPEMLEPAQQAIGQADHLCIVYPLWLETLPAIRKAFLEQVFRPGFAFELGGRSWRRPLQGKSARIVVTMGMPLLIYRWYFGAHGLKSLERSILGFCGIGPIRESLFGMVDAAPPVRRAQLLSRMRQFGAAAR
ncbi:MAG TPA: NAD(P)H-dependent oxidoreductase [Acetobacteraceae bacterium]|nr:NAD(P)H-dependent oxidoreductase [Acetobacteraceae bacterium]